MRTSRNNRLIQGAFAVLILSSIILLTITLLPSTQPPTAWALSATPLNVDAPAATPTTVLSDAVSGFELYQNGIYWWDTFGRYSCSQEFPNRASVKLRGILTAATKTLEDGRCPILNESDSNVVRDSQYLYYFEERQLVRKAVSATVTDTTTPLTKAPKLTSSTLNEALAIDGFGRLYWSTYNSGFLTIWRMQADNSETPAEFLKLTSVNGDMERMMTYHQFTLHGEGVDGIAFTESGNLWHYTTANGGSLQLLGSSIKQFWVDVSQAVGEITPVLTFYAAQDNSLLKIAPNGNSIKIYDSIVDSNTIDSVTTDNENIYFAETSYHCDELVCTPDESLRRRALSAADHTAWDLIVAQGGGVNLRSDGHYLYFNTGGSIKKVSTDAPPVQIDIEALDLEVTQAIQTMNEGFPLVSGHPTVVRGYARLVTSTDASAFYINATLTGKLVKLDGETLLSGPLQTIQSVEVNMTSSKQEMRDDADLTFLFELPESWVKADQPLQIVVLVLEMTVNPSGDPPENIGANPLANNKISTAIGVNFSTRPCLMMIPVRADHQPVLGQNPPGLIESVARARSLLPLKDFRIFTNYSSTDLEDNWILSDDGDDYDMNHSNSDPNDDDSDGALDDLDDLDAWSSDWQSCTDLHWLGMLHPDTAVRFGGIAQIDDNVLLVRISSSSGPTIAHELGHNYGRRHMPCGDFPPGQDNFDVTVGLYDPCQLAPTYFPLEDTYYGFDFFDLDHLQVKRPQNHPDIMSYADNKWPSYSYWLILMKAIPKFDEGEPLDQMMSQVQAAQIVTPSASELLYISGDLDFDADTASFNTVYRVPGGVAPQTKVARSLQAQQMAALSASHTAPAHGPEHNAVGAVIRQLSASNTVLSETLVVTKEVDIHSGGQHRYGFNQYIAFDSQTKKVQLVHDDIVLAERIGSSDAPTLTLAAPVLDEAASTLALSWTAGDSNGDALHVMILYSNDDGAQWLPLDKNVTGLEAKFNTQGLAGGVSARVCLIVDDGFNTAVVTSSPFVINKHAPTPVIDGVIEQHRLPYTATTTLYALAFDAEEGSLDGAALTWSLSGPSSRIYSGTQVSLVGLAPGRYSMTLSAKDSDGMVGTTTKQFEVLPMPVPNGSAPTLDGMCSDAAYANAVVVPLDRDGAQARLIHSGSTLSVCFSGLTLQVGNATNVVGMRVDTNSSGDATAQSDDRGFFVDEEGILFQTVGNGSDMLVTLSPAPGYTAIVAYNNTGWSAEMNIAEVLVEGWSHLAGILFQYDVASHTDNDNNWPTGGAYNQPNTWTTALFGIGPTLENRVPVANAGGDQTHALRKPTIIALDSSASYDADLDVITPTWSQTAGPGVTLSEPTTSTIRFTANPVSEPTLLRFKLTMNDSQLLSSPDEVEITLLPGKPIMIGTQQKQVYLPLIVR